MCPYKFNPLLAGKLDRVGAGVDRLDELEDVDTAGTVNGKALTFQSGTWIPETPAGGGDMLKSVYVTGLGTVYNASRLEGQTLASVRDHDVDAAKIATGTLNQARIPVLPTDRYGSAVLVSGTRAMTGNLRFLGTNRKVTFGSDGGIVSLNALTLESEGNGVIIKSDIYPHDDDSYDLGINTKYWQSIYAYVGYIPSINANILNAGTINTSTIQENVGGAGVVIDSCLIQDGTVANSARLENNNLASVRDHNVDAAKITSGTLAVARHQTLNNLNGTVDLVQIPTMDDGHIPNLEGLSYGAAFATTQIPNLPTSKITSGTLAVARHETLNDLNGTIDLDQVPTMDDGHIPNIEGLSYGAAFATTQIPNLPTSKITSGTLNAGRIPILPTDRYGSALLKDGSRALTADWDIGDGRMIQTDKIRARDAAGLALFEDGGKGIFVQDGGNVGIGTTGPSASPSALSTMDFVFQIGDNTLKPELRLAGPNNATVSSKIVFDNSASGLGMSIFFTSDNNIYGDDGLVFWNENGAFGSEFMRLKINRDNGRIGIGTVEPQARLDVNGDAKIGGTLDMNSHIIKNLTDPTSAQDAASKNYVDEFNISAINFVIDGGGSAIGTGIKGDLEVPFDCHVDRWTLLGDQHGSVAVDIWRDDYAAFPPTDADSMPGTTNTPAIRGTIAAQGTSLSGWGTQGIAAGDILRYNVDSCVSIERCTLAFKVTKT